MAVLIDTGIFIALHVLDDQFHQKSKELIRDALTGKLGRIYTSDYVIDETITTLFARTRQHSIAVEAGKYLIESQRLTILIVSEQVFAAAWSKFKSFEDKDLSFTDCTSLALMERHGVKQLMSFDRGFDGLIQRIC